MKLFADTASHEEIEYCFSRGVDDGITTNPKIMETVGDLSNGFEAACLSILEKYPSVPVSLETDLRGIPIPSINLMKNTVKDTLLDQSYDLKKLGRNVVVKIPICDGGLLAVRSLHDRGIETNVTACMTPYQALEAANAGATYVSLFANRMLDSHILELGSHDKEEIVINPEWKKIVKENKQEHFEEAWEITQKQIAHVATRLETDYPSSSLIVGSIRSPDDIYRIAKALPQILTIPTGIVKGLENISELKQIKRSISQILPLDYFGEQTLYHPMTQYTLEEFEKAADSYRK
jgi:transaldolase